MDLPIICRYPSVRRQEAWNPIQFVGNGEIAAFLVKHQLLQIYCCDRHQEIKFINEHFQEISKFSCEWIKCISFFNLLYYQNLPILHLFSIFTSFQFLFHSMLKWLDLKARELICWCKWKRKRIIWTSSLSPDVTIQFHFIRI